MSRQKSNLSSKFKFELIIIYHLVFVIKRVVNITLVLILRRRKKLVLNMYITPTSYVTIKKVIHCSFS